MPCSLGTYVRAALLVMFLPAAASAQAAPPEQEQYRLSWVRSQGAEGCPSAEQLAQAVRRRLGRDVFSNDAPRNIEGTVARIDDVWQARLTVLGADGAVLGSRDLSTQAPTCALLADAVTLAIALTIDPSAPLTEPETAAAPPAPPPQAPAPEAPRPQPPEPPSPRIAPPATPVPQKDPASSFGIGASAKTTMLLGLLPKAAPGGELAVDLQVARRVRIALGLSFFSEVRTAANEFGVGLTTASLGACFDIAGQPRVGVDACVDVQAGALEVVVYAPDPAAPGQRAWVAGRLGPRLRWKFAAPAELVLSGSAVLPFIRRELGVEGQREPIFSTPALGFFAGAGLGASIP